MTSLTHPVKCTPEEYLALERAAEYKNEYVDGEIFAMSGVSRPHSLVAGDTFGHLLYQLAGGPCEVYTSEMRVKVSDTGMYTYPDIVVACGDIQFEDDELDTLLNPTLIIEVLSPSTEGCDRGAKFAHYRRLPSLQEYVLIAQDRVLVERFSRQGESWVLTEANAPDQTMPLESIGCELPLSAVYRRVEFPSEEGEQEVEAGVE